MSPPRSTPREPLAAAASGKGREEGGEGVEGDEEQAGSTAAAPIHATHSEAMANPLGLSTLLDVASETFHLVRVRRRYFLVLLSTVLTVLLLKQGYIDYSSSTALHSLAAHSKEAAISCAQNILGPWVTASLRNNLSASQQDDFYRLSVQNCTMFKLPVEVSAPYRFSNGTFEFRDKLKPKNAATVPTFRTLGWVFMQWRVWSLVAVAWGLHEATTTTPSSNSRRMAATPQTLTELFKEQFSGRVLRGVVRVSLTIAAALIFVEPTNFLAATVRAFVADRSAKLPAIVALWKSSPKTRLANPLWLLFVLSNSTAALEPGMWGFKALWRGIQLTRGNCWNSLFIHLPLFLWEWLCAYLIEATRVNVAEMLNETGLRSWSRSMAIGALFAVTDLPRFFLMPVFYFFCKSRREKVATTA